MRADKVQVTRLIKTARGQLDGILRMIEEDRYCVDVSTQLMSCQRIIARANREVLRAHIHGCVSDACDAQDREKKLDEVCKLIDKLTE